MSGGRVNWRSIVVLMRRDLLAVRRSRAVFLPMLIVPSLLLVGLPLALGLATRNRPPTHLSRFLEGLPGDVARPLLELPESEQLIVLVHGYLLAPLFLIVPLMVSAVLAADAFAGERERGTLESLLHLPVSQRDLFVAKLLVAFVPAVAISWLGFVCYSVVANAVSWPVMQRVFVPTRLWLVVILWVAPAVAALGLGVMIRVSARARTAQEANQLGGAVILPLIFLAVGQTTGLLVMELHVALTIGAAVWVVALLLVASGVRRFTRNRLIAFV